MSRLSTKQRRAAMRRHAHYADVVTVYDIYLDGPTILRGLFLDGSVLHLSEGWTINMGEA